MRLEDVQLPEGHVIVYTGDRRQHGPGAFMQIVGSDDQVFPIEPSRVILYPEGFRVVPRALVAEYDALLDRHQREIDEFQQRVLALPQIHVEVSVR